MGFQTLTIPQGGGQFVIDISETLDIKLKAIRAYATQFPPGKERVFRLVESQNKLFGTSAGFEAGELFISATTLGAKDFVKTAFPNFDPNL